MTRLRRWLADEAADVPRWWRHARQEMSLPAPFAFVLFAAVVVPGVYLLLAIRTLRAAAGWPSPFDERYWPTKLATRDEVAAGTVTGWTSEAGVDGRPWTVVTIAGSVTHTQYTSDGLKVLDRDEMALYVPPTRTGDSDLDDALAQLRDTGVPVEAAQEHDWPSPTRRRVGPFRLASLLGDVTISNGHDRA